MSQVGLGCLFRQNKFSEQIVDTFCGKTINTAIQLWRSNLFLQFLLHKIRSAATWRINSVWIVAIVDFVRIFHWYRRLLIAPDGMAGLTTKECIRWGKGIFLIGTLCGIIWYWDISKEFWWEHVSPPASNTTGGKKRPICIEVCCGNDLCMYLLPYFTAQQFSLLDIFLFH